MNAHQLLTRRCVPQRELATIRRCLHTRSFDAPQGPCLTSIVVPRHQDRYHLDHNAGCPRFAHRLSRGKNQRSIPQPLPKQPQTAPQKPAPRPQTRALEEVPFEPFTPEEQASLEEEFLVRQAKNGSMRSLPLYMNDEQHARIIGKLNKNALFRFVNFVGNIQFKPNPANTPQRRQRIRRLLEILYLIERDEYFRRAAEDEDARKASTNAFNLRCQIQLIKGYLRALDGQRAPMGTNHVYMGVPTNRYRPMPNVRVDMAEMDAWKLLLSKHETLCKAVSAEDGARSLPRSNKSLRNGSGSPVDTDLRPASDVSRKRLLLSGAVVLISMIFLIDLKRRQSDLHSAPGDLGWAAVRPFGVQKPSRTVGETQKKDRAEPDIEGKG